MNYQGNPDANIMTPRQKQVMDLILRRTKEADGVPPTMLELAKELGVSKVTIFEHCQVLRRKGVLAPGGGRGRARSLFPQDTPARRLARLVLERFRDDRDATLLAHAVLGKN